MATHGDVLHGKAKNGSAPRELYDVKNLLADKWVLAIATALRSGPLRRVDILSTCTSYSIDEKWSSKPAVLQDSILGRHLKKMRLLGLIDRASCMKSFPPVAVYSLNPAVSDLLGLMDPLVVWARVNAEIVERAQAYSRDPAGADVGGGGGGGQAIADRNDLGAAVIAPRAGRFPDPAAYVDERAC
jgi:DNA-binding HxlR family transcriptional regulator